jgi:hypothetical protein
MTMHKRDRRIRGPRSARAIRTGLAGLAGLAASMLPLEASAESAQPRKVVALQIVTGPPGGQPYYYFYSTTGWGAAGCPNADSAFIVGDRVGSKELFAAMIQAKQLDSTIMLSGTCLNAAYFQIEGVYVMD